jgi:hypothetical protein
MPDDSWKTFGQAFRPEDFEAQKKAIAESLASCAERIIQNHQTTVECERVSMQNGHKAICAAIAAGQNLRLAKSHVEHGEFGKWVESNCPDISMETARRYMRLSKQSHVAALLDTGSLRQAYIMAGIVKDEKAEPETKSTQPSMPYSHRLCFKLIKELDELEDVNDSAQIEKILPTMETIVRWYLNHAGPDSELAREFEKVFSSALATA